MKVNADLHLHSKYSMACSKKMELPIIAREAAKKGMELIGTGDCLHPKWLAEIKAASSSDEEIQIGNTFFIPTTEVEDKNRVHHLLILPSISKAEDLAERLNKYGDLASDGRPTLKLGGCELAEIAKELGALLGPCHAFTPWTALYASHASLESCYGDRVDSIAFLELGLSADSSYADRIKELQTLTFLSNSDAHSPWANKLAREFTCFELPEISFEGLEKAILRREGYGPTLNVGFFPQEGKYNRSACIKCFSSFSLEEAKALRWCCPDCGGRIKKGVLDRVAELADFKEAHSPAYRPPYLHLIPLSEIIQMTLGHASIQTKGVKTAWNALINRFGSEVEALVSAEPAELGKVVEERIVQAILAFRAGDVNIQPGGGGRYGWVELPERLRPKPKQNPNNNMSQKNEVKTFQKSKGQKSLFDF